MNTLAAVGIAAAAGVALFVIERKVATPAVPVYPKQAPTPIKAGGIDGFLDSASTRIGTAIGGATGFGPAAGVVGRASSGFITAEKNAWSQAGTGAGQIFSGNVVTGTKNVIVGGVKTGLAPITGAYNTIRSFL